MKKGRYFLSVVEECIMNRTFDGFRAGRIEIYDEKKDTPYAIDEARFMIPEEFIEGFRELFDFKHTDKPIRIDWDMFQYDDEKKLYYGNGEELKS